MYAIVRQGQGKYYTSTVFGYYHDVKATEEFARYHAWIYSPYYVVWDEDKTHLVKVFANEQNTKYIIKQVLIVDTDTQNWVFGDGDMGCVDFLTREVADRLVQSQDMPADIFEKCMGLENAFSFDPCPEIKTNKDIENLNSVAGGFHDACIETCQWQEDGSLYVRFAGVWGCSVEVWFWDDVSYSVESCDPKKGDPYWYYSSVFMQDGYIYLVDESDMTAEEIDNSFCWFKARNMKYRVIPD